MAKFIDIAIEQHNEEAQQKIEGAVARLHDMRMQDKFVRTEDGDHGESGGVLLTSDGCMSRNYRPRTEELNERPEETHNGIGEWLKEQRLWSFAYDLVQRKGLRPTTEDLEEFVKCHLELEEV